GRPARRVRRGGGWRRGHGSRTEAQAEGLDKPPDPTVRAPALDPTGGGRMEKEPQGHLAGRPPNSSSAISAPEWGRKDVGRGVSPWASNMSQSISQLSGYKSNNIIWLGISALGSCGFSSRNA